MKPFTYHAPTTLEAAIEILARQGEGTYPLAGGTDLVTKARYGHIRPRVVVNLKRIPGLAEITPQLVDRGSWIVDRTTNHESRITNQESRITPGLRIGALVTLNQIARSSLIGESYPILAQTAGKMGSVLIRNLATVGGNLCNAAPSADTAPPLMALGAEVIIAGPQGERRVGLEDFFTGPGQTVLESGELLTAVVLPPPDPHTRASYIKHIYRQAMDIAIVGVAALVRFDPGNAVCQDARIVLGAVAPTPLRVPQAEAALVGAPLTDDRIAEAARRSAQAARPIDDTYSSAWYRREMVDVLTRRALKEVAAPQER